MSGSIKNIRLLIKQVNFVCDEKWEFVLKFPSEIDENRTMVLTIDENGDLKKLLSSPNVRANGEREIDYTPALDIFKEDVARVYSLDIDDLSAFLKENWADLLSYSIEEDICYEYSGKEGRFRDALLDMQKAYKKKKKEASNNFMKEMDAFFSNSVA